MKSSSKGISLVRILIMLGITVAFLLILVVGLIYITVNGPSENARNQFVVDMNQGEGTDWIPGVFLSDEEIESILNK